MSARDDGADDLPAGEHGDSALRKLRRLIWNADPRLGRGLVLTTLAAGLLPALIAYVGKRIVDAVETAQRGGGFSTDALYWLGLEAACMLAFVGAMRTQVVLRNLHSLKVAEHIRERIITTATSMSLEQMEDPETHDRIGLARRQAPTLPGAILQHGLGVVRGGIVVVASATLLVAISPLALSVVIMSAVPAFIHQVKFARRVHDLATMQIAKRREQGYLENILTREGFAKEVRAYGFAPTLRKRFQDVTQAIYEAEAKLSVQNTLIVGYWSALATLAVYGAYFTVVWDALEGLITLGEMTMALVIFRQTQRASESLLTDLAGLAHDRLFLSDLMAVLPESEPEQEADAEPFVAPAPSGMKFEGVGYTYPGSDEPALVDVNLELLPGRAVGLVGANGSGKSTLIKLALGLIEPTEGEVRLDGISIGDWPSEELRKRIATSFQDYARYKLEVGEGIGLGDTSKDDEAAEHAAVRAGADAFIRKLKDGYQTRLGRSFPGGTDLSGGQWQRLATARAFIRDEADILVLDEPTASLDPEAEAAFFEEMAKLPEHTIKLIAAHRLSALRDTDEILLLDKGKVRERGSHDMLMADGGRYAELFELQAQSYR